MAKSDEAAILPKAGEVRHDLGPAPTEALSGAEVLGGDTTGDEARAVAALEAEQGVAVHDLGPAPMGDVDAFGDEIDIGPEPSHQPAQPAQPAPDAARNALAVPDPFPGVSGHLVMAAQGVGLSDAQITATITQIGAEAAAAQFERYHSQIVNDASLAQNESGMMPGYQDPGSPPLGYVPPLGQLGQPAPAFPSVLPGPQTAPAAALPAPTSATGQPPANQPLISEEVKNKLREGLGHSEADTLISAMEAGHNASQAQIQAIQQQIAQSQAVAQQAQTAQRMEQVHGELTRLGSQGANADYYGQDPTRVSPEQQQRRVRTIQLAGAIANAHRTRGAPITMELAITQAHLSETASMAKQAGMEEVRAQVVRRHRSVTMPPSGPGAGVRRPANPDDEAIAAVRGAWAKHGVRV